ncbi:MAG: hypothetical protein HY694_12055 [Deltaproteobacteria bacterium]|nr:hypothetical protein [Deltaproteobacteria bacterium]
MIKSLKFGKAILAGFLGTMAMTIVMYGWPLVGLPSMDIMAALGGVFPFEISTYVMGSLIHFGMGISLALVYALVFDLWLPGPGWLRGALFSLIPWLFAITLLSPSLQMASDLFKGKEAAAANPCSVNQAKLNPCAPRASNPCAVKSNPCAVANPCSAGSASSRGHSPETMSLLVHLLYGAVLGAAYRPSST